MTTPEKLLATAKKQMRVWSLAWGPQYTIAPQNGEPYKYKERADVSSESHYPQRYLLSLPPEVLVYIAQTLDDSNLCLFLLTCRTLRNLKLDIMITESNGTLHCRSMRPQFCHLFSTPELFVWLFDNAYLLRRAPGIGKHQVDALDQHPRHGDRSTEFHPTLHHRIPFQIRGRPVWPGIGSEALIVPAPPGQGVGANTGRVVEGHIPIFSNLWWYQARTKHPGDHTAFLNKVQNLLGPRSSVFPNVLHSCTLGAADPFAECLFAARANSHLQLACGLPRLFTHLKILLNNTLRSPAAALFPYRFQYETPETRSIVISHLSAVFFECCRGAATKSLATLKLMVQEEAKYRSQWPLVIPEDVLPIWKCVLTSFVFIGARPPQTRHLSGTPYQRAHDTVATSFLYLTISDAPAKAYDTAKFLFDLFRTPSYPDNHGHDGRCLQPVAISTIYVLTLLANIPEMTSPDLLKTLNVDIEGPIFAGRWRAHNEPGVGVGFLERICAGRWRAHNEPWNQSWEQPPVWAAIAPKHFVYNQRAGANHNSNPLKGGVFEAQIRTVKSFANVAATMFTACSVKIYNYIAEELRNDDSLFSVALTQLRTIRPPMDAGIVMYDGVRVVTQAQLDGKALAHGLQGTIPADDLELYRRFNAPLPVAKAYFCHGFASGAECHQRRVSSFCAHTIALLALRFAHYDTVGSQARNAWNYGAWGQFVHTVFFDVFKDDSLSFQDFDDHFRANVNALISRASLPAFQALVRARKFLAKKKRPNRHLDIHDVHAKSVVPSLCFALLRRKAFDAALQLLTEFEIHCVKDQIMLLKYACYLGAHDLALRMNELLFPFCFESIVILLTSGHYALITAFLSNGLTNTEAFVAHADDIQVMLIETSDPQAIGLGLQHNVFTGEHEEDAISNLNAEMRDSPRRLNALPNCGPMRDVYDRLNLLRIASYSSVQRFQDDPHQ